VQRTLGLACIAWLAGASLASGAPMADETPAASESKPAAAAESRAIPIEARLPPGFKVKKRGKFTLYCRTDTPLGTRLKSETCYDEAQMRDYLVALEENKRDIDRIRSTCTNQCACGNPAAC